MSDVLMKHITQMLCNIERKMYKVTHYVRVGSILFVLSVACLIGCDLALAEDDFVYRPEFAVSGPLRDSVKWALSVEPKITSDAQQAGEISLVGGFCWNPTGYLAVTPQFQYVTKGSSADSNELRPRLALELLGTAGVWVKKTLGVDVKTYAAQEFCLI